MIRVTSGANQACSFFLNFFTSACTAPVGRGAGSGSGVEVRNSSESSGLFRSGTRLCVLLGLGVSTISRQDGRGCGSYLMHAFYACVHLHASDGRGAPWLIEPLAFPT